MKRILSAVVVVAFLAGCQTLANTFYDPNAPVLTQNATTITFVGPPGSAWTAKVEIIRSDDLTLSPTPDNDPEARIRVIIPIQPPPE